MEKIMDLHVHSCYSDGDYTPSQLVRKAARCGIGTISITDHNTVLAYSNLKMVKSVEVIPGIELSAHDDRGTMHILGYGIDPNNKQLLKRLEKVREFDIDNLWMKVEYLRKRGIVFNDKDISLIINQAKSINSVDLARLGIDYGFSETVIEAFQTYLKMMKIELQKDFKNISYQECFNIIKSAGGIPVLAHPYTLNRNPEELDHLVAQMKSDGLMGIELIHSKYDLNQMIECYNLMKRYDLLDSAGTDYHGESIKPEISLGRGIKKMFSLNVTDTKVTDYLKNR